VEKAPSKKKVEKKEEEKPKTTQTKKTGLDQATNLE